MTRAPVFEELKMNLRHILSTFSKALGHSKPGAWRLLGALGLMLWVAGCATGPGGVRVKNTSRTFQTVVIDAGHGGHDSGTRSRWGGLEKNAALDVALRLEPKLRAAGFKTVLTRKSDVFIPLDGRVRISNKQTNAVFVSIHFNEAPRRAVCGTELYYKSGVSRNLAQLVLKNVSALPGASARGLKTANFRVLRMNGYPAVLVECGYFSNPAEASRCATGAYREQLAGAIADGVYWQRFNQARPK
jgi:N-acetylmuramoyl-L-alanine amidase